MENCGITAAEGGCKPRQAPDPAAPPRADMESAPTDRGNPAANRKPLAIATHVGAHIVRPGNPAVNRKPRATATHVGAHIVRPGNPAADRKPCVAATHVGDDARIVPGTTRYRKVPREGHDPPLQTPANARSNGMAPPTWATVGRDALIPPHPAAPQTPAGGMNPAPTDRVTPAANRKPRATATHVGAHIVRPGNPAVNRKPRVAATHVGDDARIVPGTPRYRRVRGRVMTLPYKPRQTHGQTGGT